MDQSKHKVMLPSKAIANVMELDYPVLVQPKIKGIRCTFIDGKLYSKTGQEFSNPKVIRYFSSLNKTSQYCIDGVIKIPNMSEKEVSNILNTEGTSIPKGTKLYVFDLIPTNVWSEKKYSRGYSSRISDVRVVVNSLIADPKKIIDVHTDEIWSSGELVELYKKYLTKGENGVIIRTTDGKYKWRRVTKTSGEMLKIEAKVA